MPSGAWHAHCLVAALFRFALTGASLRFGVDSCLITGSFATLLEADGHAVGAAGAETAQLFELGNEAEAVVVWFRAGASPPLPAELAMLLRNAREEV